MIDLVEGGGLSSTEVGMGEYAALSVKNVLLKGVIPLVESHDHPAVWFDSTSGDKGEREALASAVTVFGDLVHSESHVVWDDLESDEAIAKIAYYGLGQVALAQDPTTSGQIIDLSYLACRFL